MACTRAQLLEKIKEGLSGCSIDCNVDPADILEIAMRSRSLVTYDILEALTKKPSMTRSEITDTINRMLIDITGES